MLPDLGRRVQEWGQLQADRQDGHPVGIAPQHR